MADWEETKDQIRQQTDIVALVGETVMLRQRGKEFWGCCPFHQEKSPSFHVNPDTGLWKCFGCGKGGDLFDYIQERENLDFVDAMRYLADRAGIDMPERGSSPSGPKRSRLKECLAAAERYYSTILMRGKGEGPKGAREYLGGRGYGSLVCKRWNLGYAPGRGSLIRELRSEGFTPAEISAANLSVNRGGRASDTFFERVIFPIHDEHGATIALSGRYLGDFKAAHTGKYVNSSETAVFSKKRNLYAFDRAKESIVACSEVVVCEGYTDVISMHEAGITNVVATMGTALTQEHIKLLDRCRVRRIICMFDGDEAGQRAAERALRFIEITGAELSCVVLPDGLDPADFLSARGAEAMRAQLAGATSLIDFVYERRMAGLDLSTPGAKVKALDEMAGVLAPLKNSKILDEYATNLARELKGDVAEVKRMIKEKPIAADRDEAPPFPSTYDSSASAYTPAANSAEIIASFNVLSADERQQLRLERELLSLMATRPDLYRSEAERIGGFSWADSRHESIAWAILATAENASAADAVAAAQAAEPSAAEILSSGTLVSAQGMSDERKATFMLDVVDLYSCKRRVADVRARLSGAALDDDARRLMGEAGELQARIREISGRLSASNELS